MANSIFNRNLIERRLDLFISKIKVYERQIKSLKINFSAQYFHFNSLNLKIL